MGEAFLARRLHCYMAVNTPLQVLDPCSIHSEFVDFIYRSYFEPLADPINLGWKPPLI